MGQEGNNWVGTTQIPAYAHCRRAVEGKVKWLALIDTDEFIIPVSISILTYLREHEEGTGLFSLVASLWNLRSLGHSA